MRFRLTASFLVISQLSLASANKVPVGKLLDQMIHRSTLAEPGGRPFYLKATITDKENASSEFNGTVEEYWLSPTKWRRVIKLRDFSQTHVVNGDAIHEENNGDYFPVYDEMLADEIVDPLPKSAVDLMNQLGLMGAEPGSGQGQCMAEKYFNDAEGTENRVLLSYDCKTGLLIYLWSPTCCYGVMTDYRKFHDKIVAYATKDNPINIRIDTLRDLDNVDESLFAVSQSTLPSQQMTTERVGERQARTFLVKREDVQWPPVNKKLTVESVKVEVVIGRDGNVKQAWTYSPVENQVEDAVLTAVKKWTFQPQNVDGIPAQIQTTLILPFPPEYRTSANEPLAKPIFDGVRATSDLRLEGAPAFHMKASFRSSDNSVDGTYEETWISAAKWRREVKLSNNSLLEVRTEDAFYRIFGGKFAPRLADDVMDSISFGIPGDGEVDFHEADWTVANTTLSNLPLLRVSRGYISPQGRPDALTYLYFVDEKTKFLRGHFHYSTLTIYNDLKPFAGKNIARKLTNIGGDMGKMEISIDILEPVDKADESLFNVSGAKPVFTTKDDYERFTAPRVVYSLPPSIHGFTGKALCQLSIDEHGHVRDVEVQGTTDDSFIKAIRAALMSWEYEPATVDGHPSPGVARVRVQ
ncbi:MAG TPA: energy transducer TonB [Terriglobales bacterium]|nr:energy transducer TonB [Terriglobales bacterium]